MRALLRMALALPMVLAIAHPAGAQEFVPVFNTERTYIHCAGDRVTANEQVTYSWNTTAPGTSVTTGAGCGSYDSARIDGDGVTWKGTHTGNLDQLTVHAWVIDFPFTRAGVFTELYVDVSVQIDGNDVVGEMEARIPPIESSNGISRLLEFSVTRIGLVSEADLKQHEVVVNMEASNYLADGDEVAWVLDASEVQSGVTFSPTALAAHRIPAGG